MEISPCEHSLWFVSLGCCIQPRRCIFVCTESTVESPCFIVAAEILLFCTSFFHSDSAICSLTHLLKLQRHSLSSVTVWWLEDCDWGRRQIQDAPWFGILPVWVRLRKWALSPCLDLHLSLRSVHQREGVVSLCVVADRRKWLQWWHGSLPGRQSSWEDCRASLWDETCGLKMSVVVFLSWLNDTLSWFSGCD